MLKKYLFVALLLILPLISFADLQELPENVPITFVIKSDHAIISPTKKNHYALILTGVHPHILFFSHKPKRITGYVDTDRFFTETWDHMVGTHDETLNIAPASIASYKKGLKDTGYDINVLTKPKRLADTTWEFTITLNQTGFDQTTDLGEVTFLAEGKFKKPMPCGSDDKTGQLCLSQGTE